MSDTLFNPNAFKLLIKEAVKELADEGEVKIREDEKARRLSEINAKPFISVPEAELLLGCSDSHLYRQIKLARQGQTKHPIPFLDKERLGIYSFPREELIQWARGPQLVTVKSEAA